MLSKGKTEDRGNVTCEACGSRGHKAEKCWTVVGYPKWHNKYKKTQRKEGEYNGSNQRWSKGKGQRMVANVQAQGENEEPVLTTQQVEQLLKLLPCGSGGKKESMEDEEIEEGFAGIATCCYSFLSKNEWVIDTGATDHMICDENQLSNVIRPKRNSKINLPDGKSVGITYVGTLTLENQLELKHVLCVPEFKHNLLSVTRLTKDNNCKVVFGANVCLIQDLATQSIKGIGKVQGGLYHLLNEPVEKILTRLGSCGDLLKKINKSHKKENMLLNNNELNFSYVGNVNKGEISYYALWHNRLGHAPIKKLKQIGCINHKFDESKVICFTCPLEKFIKLPYENSESHAFKPFDLIHIDTWGPYKVKANG
ncbi:Retrovirus-related Pol polyprotein from transposon RE2 [Bienertia sinuspersici]